MIVWFRKSILYGFLLVVQHNELNKQHITLLNRQLENQKKMIAALEDEVKKLKEESA